MMKGPERRSPHEAGNVSRLGGNAHIGHASADVLLQRLDSVQISGNGWRARCPACGGTSRKLAIAESEGRVLLHCFSCAEAAAILAAVGLTWADLHPPQHWPLSPEQRRSVRRAIREAGIVSAIEVVAMEGAVIEAAGRQLLGWQCLSAEDDAHLSLAVQRASKAAFTLRDAVTWKGSE
jgi:hypothetical protein